MKHPVKPTMVGIEKKSTGVTLLSVLSEYQGLHLIEIERTKASGSKTARFLEAQPYIAQRLVSLPTYGKHTAMCIEHCKKITANNAHRFDDIADTLYDAVKIALIDKVIQTRVVSKQDYSQVAKSMMSGFNRVNTLRNNAFKA